MNKIEEIKRNNYIKKLVSNARAIISHQVAIPLGVVKMDKIIYWIENIKPIETIDLKVFKEYNEKTHTFFIGSPRLSVEVQFLLKEDEKLDKITEKFKKEIILKCFEIIDQFGES